jgi:cytochrome P450
VLQKNAGNYHMSDIRVKRMGEFQGQGLLNSHGEEWLRKRRFLAQGFLPDRLAELLPLQEDAVDETLARLDLAIAEGPVDMYRLMLGFTFRLVGNSLFGSRMTDAEIEHLGHTIKTIQRFIVRQIVQPYKIPWFRLSGQSRYYQNMRIEADKVARAYIEARRCRRPRPDGAHDGDSVPGCRGTHEQRAGLDRESAAAGGRQRNLSGGHVMGLLSAR